MTSTAVGLLITGGLTDYGVAMLAILASIIVVIVGFYVFKRGARWFQNRRDDKYANEHFM